MPVYRREYSGHRDAFGAERDFISSFIVLLGGCGIMGSQREYVRQNLNREDVDMARTVNHVVHHRGLGAESRGIAVKLAVHIVPTPT